MNVTLLKPYGFCLGVSRVIDMVEQIVIRHKDMPIYCVGQIVHNEKVNEALSKKNIKILSGDKNSIIDSIDYGVVIFSAHGTDEKIVNKAKEKGLIVYDVVCPFVKKEFEIIKNKITQGYDIIYIGKKNHDEANAALSISNNIHLIDQLEDIEKLNIANKKIIVINQTTLSIDSLNHYHEALKEKYNNVELMDEICNATRIRQKKLKDYDANVDGVIVVGDKNSNNTTSLKNNAINKGYDTILISSLDDLDVQWLKEKKDILLVSGTSTPNNLVESIELWLKNNFF